jgi:hypothetical protein
MLLKGVGGTFPAFHTRSSDPSWFAGTTAPKAAAWRWLLTGFSEAWTLAQWPASAAWNPIVLASNAVYN